MRFNGLRRLQQGRHRDLNKPPELMTNRDNMNTAFEKLQQARQSDDLIEIEFASIQVAHFAHLLTLDVFQTKQEAKL